MDKVVYTIRIGKPIKAYFQIKKASPLGKLSAARTDEGRLTDIASSWVTVAHAPLIRPCGATFPPRGKAKSYHPICLFAALSAFRSGRYSTSMMAKLPTPCMASQLNPLSHQLKAKAGALLLTPSFAPYDIAAYTAGNTAHALPAAPGGCPAPESCRGTIQ